MNLSSKMARALFAYAQAVTVWASERAGGRAAATAQSKRARARRLFSYYIRFINFFCNKKELIIII